MKINKFIFIIPNTVLFDSRYWHMFPYTVGLLSAMLVKEGYSVSVIDANLENMDEEELKNRIEIMKPDIVAISAMTIIYKKSIHRTLKIVKEVNKNIITIVGGIYPTLSLDIVTKDPNIDYIISSEGEVRLLSLLKAIEAGKGFDKIDGLSYREKESINFIINPLANTLLDLDSLPFPNYNIFNINKYMNFGQKFTQTFQFRASPYAQTMTSRGCPFKCVFCSSRKLFEGKSIRYRSPQNVLAEVDMLVKEYGIKEIIFLDDSFLQSKKRAIEIMQGLIDRKYGLLWKAVNLSVFLMDNEILEMMKKSGCYQVNISIESGHPRTLKRIKKPINLKTAKETIANIKKFDFEIVSNFIIGFPGETFEEIRQTFKYAEEIDVDYVLFSIATPLPGTELFQMCKEYNCLPENFNFENFDFYGFGKAIINSNEFTPFELQALRSFEWERINFKSEKKKERIAKMVGITMEELDQWRKQTRRSIGLHVESIDKVHQNLYSIK